MDKIRRNERLSAMMKILSDAPNQIYTLSWFCEMFGTAKSSMSEDVDILRGVAENFGLGCLETLSGAAGGVYYRPVVKREDAQEYISGLCGQLSGSSRLLPGGFLYYSDILSSPEITQKMGEIIATEYFDDRPDFVLTMETKGIPVALMTARALGVPLVIARHTSKVYEGPAVNINYVSGSSGSIQTMSLARRAVREGQRTLIVDDFLKGGGTAFGMMELMREFNAQVIGSAFVMETADPPRKRIQGEKSLMTLRIQQTEEGETALVTPADWLTEKK